jgi:hypothetical protein
MVSSTTEVPLKMLISTDEIRKTLLPVSEQTSTEYIILQNNKLHARLLSNKEESMHLQQQIDELELEVDSLTRTRTSLQGYVKNEVELAENWKSLAKSHKYIHSKIAMHSNVMTILNILIMILSMLIPNHTWVVCILICNITITMFIQVNAYTNFKKQENSPANNKIIETIKKTELSNTYIQELIDNI